MPTCPCLAAGYEGDDSAYKRGERSCFASIFLQPPTSLFPVPDSLPCGYTPSAARTPQLTSVTPASGTATGITITLAGSGFAAASSPPAALVGGVPCTLLAFDDTSATCRASKLTAGAQPLILTVPGRGDAAAPTGSPPVVYHADLVLAAASPASGSVAGGVMLSLEGEGFDPAPSRMSVRLQWGAASSAECTVVSSSFGALSCRTTAAPSSATGQIASIEVSVLGAGGLVSATASSSNAFRFLGGDSLPLVRAIEPASGSIAGGLRVCLSGERLDSEQDAPLVTIGGSTCPTVSLSAASICCTTPGGTADVCV